MIDLGVELANYGETPPPYRDGTPLTGPGIPGITYSWANAPMNVQRVGNDTFSVGPLTVPWGEPEKHYRCAQCQRYMPEVKNTLHSDRLFCDECKAMAR
jgi:formylmethanofuran dehydrogenase subunit E